MDFLKRLSGWLSRSLARHFRLASQPSGSADLCMGNDDAPMRLLVVANALIPTVQLSLLAPLADLVDSGQCQIQMLTEQAMKQRFGKNLRSEEAWRWVKERWSRSRPTHLIFCRYSGPHGHAILDHAIADKIPSIYCIDDDLLNVPRELGQQKYEYHNHPLRLATVRHLLDSVDLVYCSNERLKSRLRKLGIEGNLCTGKIFCAGTIVMPAERRSVAVIGYMGFDHAHDFEIPLHAIVKVLNHYPHLKFELFGKIPKPKSLDQFGERVSMIAVVADYDQFLTTLAARRWDIGICPLAPTDFNQVKNINKWIEYTSVGTAVIASSGSIYDDCCSGGSGVMVADDEWFNALSNLISDNEKRFKQVQAAQKKMAEAYSVSNLRSQLLIMLEAAGKAQQSRNQLLEKHYE